MEKRSGSDMLTGSLWDKLLWYALPVAATAVLEQLFNASAIAVVGNFTGELRTVAVAAVGANGPIVSFLVTFFIGISMGANVVIAQAVGRRDEGTVRRASATALVLALIGGVMTAAAGEWLAPHVLAALSVPEEAFPHALLYLRIYLLGLPFIFLYNFEAAVFRSVGETKVPLRALLFSGALNAVLCLFFVIACGMDVDGAALATVLANLAAAGILLHRLMKTDEWIRIELSRLRPDGEILRKILRLGFPAGMQGGVFCAANIIIQGAINSLGTVVIAASTAAFSLEILVYFVINAFGQACMTFTGQNYGAGKIARCRRVLFLSLAEGAAFALVSMAVILGAGDFLLALFTDDPEVIACGYIRLILVFVSYPFTVCYETMSGYMRGFGISLAPAVTTTVCITVIRIAWVIFVFPKDPTFTTIMWVYPVSLAATAAAIFAALLWTRPAGRAVGDRG